MDEQERWFREGLRQAADRRPPLEIDLAEVSSQRQDDVSEPGVVSHPPAAARSRIVRRWAIGLSAAAAGAVVLIMPGTIGSGPIQAQPAPTPASTMPVSPTPNVPLPEPATHWALPLTIAPDDLPLTRYFDAIRQAQEYEDQRLADSEFRGWWDAREAYLATCMEREGQDYVSRRRAWDGPEPGSEAEARAAVQNHNRLGIPTLGADRELVAQIGYGVRSAADELPDQNSWIVDDAENVRHWETLSLVQQEKYQATLSDCQVRFQREHPKPSESSLEDAISDRFEIVPELWDFRVSVGGEAGIEADPRIVELNTEWRTCMAAAGVPIEAARAKVSRPGPWDGPMEAFHTAVRTGADGVAAEVGDYEPGRVDQQSLIGSGPEIRIALADYDCRVASDYLSRFIDVQWEREQAFLDTHRKALDELLAYVEDYVP